LSRRLHHGNDYYDANEHNVAAEGKTSSSWGEIFGYNEITRQYYERYGLPVMHTETNTCEGPRGDEAGDAATPRKRQTEITDVR
jgi:beta-glucosidase